MANDKKRGMTVKGFISKASKGGISAAGFLSAHKEWLASGELAPITTPILKDLEGKKAALLAERKDTEGVSAAALEAITKAVYDHWQAGEIAKGEAAMNRPAPTPKNWVVTVYDANGRIATRVNNKGEVEDLIQGFEKAQDADGWADRRLVEGAPDCYAVVQHSTMLNKDGEPIATIIMRGDAMERTFRAPKSAAMRKVGGSTSALSFRPKVKGDHFHFSRG